MELHPGQVIGNDYRIVQPLAAGGMGAVYVAEQLSTGKRRALKVMHRELAADAESQRRFLQEARVGSLIASEHIVEVQNAGIDPATGHPFLVMELLDGEDLQTRLARGPLSLDEARMILGQLCHALGAAHDAHVVHRDLKPQNVFLSVRRSTSATLHVKVLDFGIATVVESHKATAATGTPLWLAPEQTERGQISSAADVWALGLLVFTMLTGATFWKTPSKTNGTLVDLLSEILRDPIPSASVRAAELGRPVPAGFDSWFARCLSRPPHGRFPNAREAYDALVPVLGPAQAAGSAASPMAGTFAPPPSMQAPTQYAAPLVAHPVARPVAHPAPAAPPRSSRVGLFIGLAILLLILGGGAVGIAVFARSGDITAMTPTTPVVDTATTVALPPGVSAPPMRSASSTSKGVFVFVVTDVPEVQNTLVSDATLTPKIEECVTAVRGQAKGSLVFAFEVTSAGFKSMVTNGQPLGPHIPCVINVISKRPVPPLPPKKKVTVTVMVSWT